MKDRAEVATEVCTIIATSLRREGKILEETNIADLSEDSIQLFELLLAFEKKYETETTYEDVVKLRTVGDIINHITDKVYSV